MGLDPDPAKIPAAFGTGVAAMEAFCSAVVEATLPYAVAYKPNLAFFEQYGAEGWAALERVVANIPSDVLVIADAKRGDIGNTALKYAQALFTGLGADAVTVAPYMGRDSVEPFTSFSNKWTVLLALTSNPSAEDFEFHGETPLFEDVLSKSQTFEGADRLMYVVGATRPELLGRVRKLVPRGLFVGAWGGGPRRHGGRRVHTWDEHHLRPPCQQFKRHSVRWWPRSHRGGSQARQPGRSRQVAGVDAHRIGEGQAALSRA